MALRFFEGPTYVCKVINATLSAIKRDLVDMELDKTHPDFIDQSREQIKDLEKAMQLIKKHWNEEQEPCKSKSVDACG